MKPFDLQKALAGEPVVYRNGTVPKEWHYFKTGSSKNDLVSIDQTGDMKFHFVENGSLHDYRPESSHDLFMAEKPKVKKDGWVILRPDKTFVTIDGIHIYDNISGAEHNLQFCRVGSSIAKIEWEEEAE
jgi:hypothetical protein